MGDQDKDPEKAALQDPTDRRVTLYISRKPAQEITSDTGSSGTTDGNQALEALEEPSSHEQELVGQLRRLVTRLREGELLMLRRWIEEELRLLHDRTSRLPTLRLVRTPSSAREPLPDFSGSFVELMGEVRQRLHELPEDRLIVLHLWVTGKLQDDFGHDKR